MKLKVYHYEDSTTVLGKGNRFALWVQGCKKECLNCLVPDSWDLNSGELMAVKELAKKVKNVDGITISGGEPFLQPLALSSFLDALDGNLNVIIYSGYSYAEIVKNSSMKELLKRVDILIDGEYIDELNYDEPLVGSFNQNIYIISDKGQELAEYILSLKSREVEFKIKNGELFSVGVLPRKLEGLV